MQVRPPNAEPGGFLDPLFLEYVGGARPYRVARRFRYHSALIGRIIEVPADADYRTDFASVPRLFWRILPPHGPYAKSAVIHDWLCDQRGRTGINSKTTHKIFREAMIVDHVPSWKVATMYRAVRWFGPRFRAKKSQPV